MHISGKMTLLIIWTAKEEKKWRNFAQTFQEALGLILEHIWLNIIFPVNLCASKNIGYDWIFINVFLLPVVLFNFENKYYVLCRCNICQMGFLISNVPWMSGVDIKSIISICYFWHFHYPLNLNVPSFYLFKLIVGLTSSEVKIQLSRDKEKERGK